MNATELFAEEGAELFLLGRREEPLKAVSSDLDCFYCTCNISDADQVKATVQQAANTYGGIDILVNNAGVLLPEKPAGQTRGQSAA